MDARTAWGLVLLGVLAIAPQATSGRITEAQIRWAHPAAARLVVFAVGGGRVARGAGGGAPPSVFQTEQLILACVSPPHPPCLTRRKDDRSLILMAEPFGFGSEGHINISLSKFAPLAPWDQQKNRFVEPHINRMGFFITVAEAEAQLELNLAEGLCALDATDVTLTLFTFDEINATTHDIARSYNLAEMIQVCVGGWGGWGMRGMGTRWQRRGEARSTAR